MVCRGLKRFKIDRNKYANCSVILAMSVSFGRSYELIPNDFYNTSES